MSGRDIVSRLIQTRESVLNVMHEIDVILLDMLMMPPEASRHRTVVPLQQPVVSQKRLWTPVCCRRVLATTVPVSTSI